LLQKGQKLAESIVCDKVFSYKVMYGTVGYYTVKYGINFRSKVD